jgi:acetyl-CoA acetyltransferase
MSESTAKERGIEPIAYLKAWAKAADDPAIPKAGLKPLNWSWKRPD